MDFAQSGDNTSMSYFASAPVKEYLHKTLEMQTVFLKNVQFAKIGRLL